MNQEQAKKLIKDTFESAFNKCRFIIFIKNLLNSIDGSKAFHAHGYVKESFKNIIKTYERVGTYESPDGKKIDIIIVYLQKTFSINHARVTQRNFAGQYLSDRDEKDAGLFAFVSPNESDWRFSLVKMDYGFRKNPNGKPKIVTEFSSARRWSFLVGENEQSHTAQSQLIKLVLDDEYSPTLKQLEEAFNIETVTTEFFLEYRNLFIRTKEALDKIMYNNPDAIAEFEAKGVNTVNFAKKLLGQIIFLYFLQKKGWFGVDRDNNWGSGSKKFLRELFEKKHSNYNNFFNDILEPLFYEALRIDRSHDDDYYSRFNCKIPFLNGGLFDPIGNYDWVHIDINLPNSLFSNNILTKAGDNGDGILDIFDRYNFTVREDEPLEKEVAIDPELLGKAYEKFNAIRPDNFEEYKKALKSGKKGSENKFNKQYGVYYTPREIVHYMCQQSLINYLIAQLNGETSSYEIIGESNLDMFGNKIKKGQLDISIEHKNPSKINKKDIEKFIQLGEQFRENDEIALIKEEQINNGQQKSSTIEPFLDNSIRKNASLIDEKLKNITICDPAVGSGAFPVGMMSEIVKARTVLNLYIKNNFRNTYNFKRQCIEQSLYGVDVDPGAVEITKLRLWLSLIVEEEEFKEIKPLPNLDYKIVCGDSLIGVEKNLLNHNLFIELERLKPLYFNETNPNKKKLYKDKIDDIINQLTNGHKDFDFQIYFSEVFHKKGGFDVVIANPPYIDSETMVKKGQKNLRDYISKTYMMTKGNWDIYIAFFECGFKVLNSQGVLAFITPDKWLAKPFGKKFRKSTIDKFYSILKAGRKIFEDVKVDAVVTFFTNSNCFNLKVFEFVDNKIVFKAKINKKIFHEPFNFDYIFSNHLPLLQKINKFSDRIVNLLECENACATSDAYKLKSFIKDISEDKFDQKKHFKVINTGTIGKYISKWGKVKMTYLGDKYLYPVVGKQKFLNSFNNSYSKKSSEPKIIIKGLTLLDACLDAEANFIPGKSTLIIAGRDLNQLKLLLAILNSNLASFYIKEKYPSYSYNKGINFTKDMINTFPLPKLTEQQRENLVSMIDKILFNARNNHYLGDSDKLDKINKYEGSINQEIYKLYNLTEKEIKIIENS